MFINDNEMERNIMRRPVEERRLFYSLLVPFSMVLLMFVVMLVSELEGMQMIEWGIRPRVIEHLWGVVTSPFVHGSWSHLGSNVPSFMVLMVSLLYFYREIGYRVFWLIYVLSGLFVWFLGRDSWHVGMSGVIYGMAAFLFFSGIMRGVVSLMAISLMVTFLYGGMVWGVLPLTERLPYSWEAHLGGTLAGMALSVVYRGKGPQAPVKVWDEDGEDEVPEGERYWEEGESGGV